MSISESAVSSFAAVDLDRLQTWMTEQRWFASKGRPSQPAVRSVVTLSDWPPLALALIETRLSTGVTERYQLLVGPSGSEPSGMTSFDALDDPSGRTALAQLLVVGRPVRFDAGTVDFHWEPQDPWPRPTEATVERMRVEQSNSSLLIDDRVVLKLYRRLEPGANPELEMLRFLSGRGFAHVPPLVGWIDLRSDSLDATLAVAQGFVAGSRNGWDLTLDALANGDGDTEGLRALGQVVGSMHRVLGGDIRHPAFAPEEPSAEWMTLLGVDIDQQIQELFASLPPSPALAPLAGQQEAVRALLDSLLRASSAGRLIRTHGDLHLGQVLRTSDAWVILDFEGEPARSMIERRRKRSPLRDVAGMLRSFAYAASAVRLQRGRQAPSEWEEQARRSFLAGYLDSVDPLLLPPGTVAIEQLLAVFELEKAVYELGYEIQNRPEWAAIPVAAICRLLEHQ